MSTLQAIVFDMDGTLADTEDIHRQAFNLAFTEFKCDWQWSCEEYHDLLAVSGGRERLWYYRSIVDAIAPRLAKLAPHLLDELEQAVSELERIAAKPRARGAPRRKKR